MIERDRRITTESIADTFNISVHTILVQSLGVCKLSARWVPRLLRPNQQQTRVDLSMEILNQWDEDSVIRDETWLYQCDPQDKIQSKSHDPQFHSDGLKGWYQRLQKCIGLNGAYVEK
ncbi:uncharacterized protein LOC119576047 [Penaeus monodon]|uniref:uncharacterized protein LOC119576047 n=1 Tax=Penaeus monodon TaxID=6687 RepID=UPI0018A7DC55|nr:uncharacterized protein LOC119576047 [Penaeus monodon]